MIDLDVDALLSIPYWAGGRDPETGLDCWGLVMHVMRLHGVEVPDYGVRPDSSHLADAMYQTHAQNWQRCDLMSWPPPLVVAIRNHPTYVNHFGVYVGDWQMIHTLAQSGVTIERTSSQRWSRRIMGYYRWTG